VGIECQYSIFVFLNRTLEKVTKRRTFSSNLSPNFIPNDSGANIVHPPRSRSPSERTRSTEVAIASARIFERRIKSPGSLDCNFRRNSEKTESVRFPNIKSITAWQNQSLKVAEYILSEKEVSKWVICRRIFGLPR
jgi:hypothetical protein